MPRDLVLTPTYPTAISHPSGAESSDALTWAVPLQDLANRSEFSLVRMVEIANLLASERAIESDVKEYGSSNNSVWLKPTGAQLVYIALVDGGGGGGAGASGQGGFGGQSGCFVHGWFFARDLPERLDVKAGRGGAAGQPGLTAQSTPESRKGQASTVIGETFAFGTYRGGNGVELTDETAAYAGPFGGGTAHPFSPVYQALRIAAAGGKGQSGTAAAVGQNSVYTGGAAGTSSGGGRAGGGGGGGSLAAYTGSTPPALSNCSGGAPGKGRGGGGGGGCFDTATGKGAAGGPGNPGYVVIVTFGAGPLVP